MDSSSSAASRGATDALIAKPPRPSPVHAQRGYGLLHQTSPPAPVTAAPAAPVPPLGLAVSLAPGAEYTLFHSPPSGSISVADATPGGSMIGGSPNQPPAPPGSYPHDSIVTRGARAASMHVHIEDDDAETVMTKERPLCSCCSACHSCACDRCLSHCWWLGVCCGFVMLSSLPRFLTLVDFIVTLLIYSLSFSGRTHPSLSFWQFLERDWTHYNIRTSGGSLVVLAFVRMCVLFFVFAYRFHLRRRAFMAATTVAVCSVLFVLVKFSINTNPHLHSLLLWSLVITCLEYLCWLALRRQRVKRPTLILPPEVVAEAEAEAAAVAAAEAAALAQPQEQALLNPVAASGDDDLETGSGVDSYARSTLLAGSSGSGSGRDTPVLLTRSLAADIQPSSSSFGSSVGRSGIFGSVGGPLAGKQSSSYQRLGGEEPRSAAAIAGSFHAEPSPRSSPRRTNGGSSGGVMIRPGSSLGGSGPGSSGGASASPFLGSSAPRSLSMSIPRLSLSLGGPGNFGSFSGSSSGTAAERELDATALADADSLFMQIDSLLVHYKLSINGRAIVGRDPEAQARAAVARGLGLGSGLGASVPSEDECASGHSGAEDEALSAGSAAARQSFPSSASASGSPAGAGGPFPHPVVLLHGFGSSLFQWRAVWNELASRCSVVVAFDRPGFGLTSRPLRDASGGFGTFVAREGEAAATGNNGGSSARGTLREQPNPYTQDYSVSLLQRLLARLGLGSHPAVLVGHSTGGTIALRSALSAPARCMGLFLVSPHVLTQGFPDLVKSLLKTKLGALITQQLVRSELGEVAWKRSWFDAKRIPPESLAHYQRTLLLRNQVEALQEVAACASRAQDASRDPLANLVLHLHRLAPPPIEQFAESERERERERERGRERGLSALATSSSGSSVNSPPGSTVGAVSHGGSGGGGGSGGVPVCIVHGLQDKLLSVSESVRVYKQMKADGVSVTLIKIDHCASVPHEEYPILFTEHLLGFLHEVEQRATGGSHSEAVSDEDDEAGDL